MNDQSVRDEAMLEPPGKDNQLLRDFEEQLQKGLAPRLEDFLALVSPRHQRVLLPQLLLLEWRHRHRLGELFIQQDYHARLPDHAFTITLAWEHWLTEKGNPPSSPPHSSTLIPGSNLSITPVTPLSTPSSLFPEYELVECLGIGGMGEVYKAIDPRLKRTVALKRIKTGSASAEHLTRFRREAEAMARLQHPHIVQVYAWDESMGEPLLVLEYVPGGTLEQRLSEGPLPAQEAARLVAILAWAIHAAHEAGLVHRDLKPENILMAPPVPGNPGTVAGGFPKITDFGLALLTDAVTRTMTGMAMGTPGYMSPEQAAGRTWEIGPPSDIWALGVILYQCLTGTLPFEGRNPLETLDRIKTQQLPPLPGTVPPELASIVLDCLNRKSAYRPTAVDLAKRLDRFASGIDAEPDPTVVRRLERKRPSSKKKGKGSRQPAQGAGTSRRWRWVLAGLIVLLAAGGVGVFFLLPLFTMPGGPPVRVLSFEVEHLWGPQENAQSLGVLGQDSFEVHSGDALRIRAELSEPATGYLILFAPNGEETLLWPVDEQGHADPDRVPDWQERIEFPASKDRPLVVEASKQEGMHFLVLAASRAPLPPYRSWKETRRSVSWQRMPAGMVVWTCDGERPEPLFPPGHERFEPKGPPPRALHQLCRSLRSARVETVQAIAFAVQGKR